MLLFQNNLKSFNNSMNLLQFINIIMYMYRLKKNGEEFYKLEAIEREQSTFVMRDHHALRPRD